MYTFYFQVVDQLFKYKFVACKGSKVPEHLKLGSLYSAVTVDAFVSSGYRVVIQPRRMTDSDKLTQMFYAPGWRSSKIAENAKIDQAFASALAWTEFGDDEVPANKQEFINWANGEVKDFCSEDFGQDPIHVDSLERESPGIGPLPPMASIAPLAPLTNSVWAWSGTIRFPESMGSFATTQTYPPIGTMLNPAEKVVFADSAKEKPSWRQLFKKWFNPEF
jgi:hypothetical protein